MEDRTPGHRQIGTTAMTTSPKLLTFAQAAQRLGIGILEIRRMVRAEQIPVVRDGRRVRIPAVNPKSADHA
jgi:excisionase family DNA binding protein